jgi:hypothetical protein
VTILHKIHYSIEVPSSLLCEYCGGGGGGGGGGGMLGSLLDDQQLVKFINIFQPGSSLVRQFIFNLQLW